MASYFLHVRTMQRDPNVPAAALERLFHIGTEASTLAAVAQTCRSLRNAAHRHAADLSHEEEPCAVCCGGGNGPHSRFPSSFVYTACNRRSLILTDVLGCSCTGRSVRHSSDSLMLECAHNMFCLYLATVQHSLHNMVCSLGNHRNLDDGANELSSCCSCLKDGEGCRCQHLEVLHH